jgi:hypothetical protein
MQIRDNKPVLEVPSRPDLLICDSIGRPLENKIISLRIKYFSGATISAIIEMINLP